MQLLPKPKAVAVVQENVQLGIEQLGSNKAYFPAMRIVILDLIK